MCYLYEGSAADLGIKRGYVRRQVHIQEKIILLGEGVQRWGRKSILIVSASRKLLARNH